jgi:hypothetical protein
MINRAKMPRQLRNKGGITNVTPRTNYFLGGIKRRIRKLIPNELADVAVKAAPFIAPFQPGIAAAMRGIGRFDQRGSISDALKQGALTFGFGKGVGALGGAQSDSLFGGQTFTKEGFKEGPIGRLFQRPEVSVDEEVVNLGKKTTDPKGIKSVIEGAKKLDNIPIIGELPNMVKQQILIGGVSGAATYIYEAFLKEEPPQQEGETYEEYIARRKENVGRKMKGYFDNYFKFDKEYSSMTPEQKQAFIDRVNVKDGGRIKYQTGGITMANTLAENIRRNIANQAAINQKLEQARTKIPTKAAPIKIQPSPKQNLTLKDINQTGMPRTITQDDIDTSNFLPPLTMSTPTPAPTSERVRYITETGEPASGPGPNVGRIIEQEEFKPPKVDMTDPMFTGFDYSKPVNWSPGQPAPEGYRVVNMMGDEFLERKFPSKEEIARLPTAFFDDFQQLPGPMGSGPLAPMVAPFEKYGITPEQYANMSPEDQEAVMNRVDRDMGIYGDNIGKRIYGIPDDEADDYGITFAKGGRVNFEEGGTGFMKWLKSNYGLEVKDLDLEQYVKYSREFNNENPDPYETGRKKNAMGSMPTGIMKTNKAGVMERDYRDKGGFVPVGIKEKADDVPAMLSKNEFVFTADAVRGAGNGSIEKGAQRMYDTMKNLEKRVV